MQIGAVSNLGVIVEEYGGDNSEPSDGNSIIGYIEPAGKQPSWIAWFTKKGDLILYTQRSYLDGANGAVIGEPIRVNSKS